jgi:tetratricopeptide (TPR) repeat protein
MFRRYFLPVLAGVAFIISTNLIASAQVGALRGHVVLAQADGTKVPVADATIDVFRTDVSGKYSTKTNKKGEFVFAGLPYSGDYVIAASAPAAQPNWVSKVKAGRDVDYPIELTPGDGHRLTLAEINSANRGSGGSAKGGSADSEVRQPTAEEKAKAAELAKQAAEITARNEKAVKSNEVVARTFKDGNDALNAKNYDEAIKQYEEGLAADPEQPALLVNEGRAYTARGVKSYNAAVTSKDEAAQAAGKESAKADFKAAAAATTKAVAMIKAQSVPTDPAELTRYTNNKLAAHAANTEAHRLLVGKADPAQVDAGVTAYEEYIAAEPDPVKKSKAEHELAQLLFDANAYERAKSAYEKILGQNPDDADAQKNVGLILYNLGFMKEAEGKKDEAKASYQEAANYLQRFVDKAPDGPMKADAQDILKNMKETQNVQAEKTSTPPRRRRP